MERSVTEKRTGYLSFLVCVVLVLATVFTAACSGDDSSTKTSASASQSATTAGAGQSTAGSLPNEASGYEAVTFQTEDGLTLSGRLYQSDSPAGPDAYWNSQSGVVLCHMYPSDQTSWDDVAEYLAANGLSVLTFDFRGYGDSEGSKDIEHLDRDVASAAHFLSSQGVQEIVLVGASMGGTASLKTAVDLEALSLLRLAGVVTLSAPVEFMGLSAEQAVPQLVVPLLFVAAEDDVGASGAKVLEQLSGGAAQLEIVTGNEHGTDLFRGPEAEQIWTLLLDFLTNNLPGTS